MIDNYMLYSNLPKIDLHGCTKEEATILAKEFINDNVKLKNPLLVIVHGKGAFILKNEIHKMLKQEKRVISYKLDIFNPGQTIVEIDTK